MSTRTTALLLGGGAAVLLSAALWLAVSALSRPVVEEGRTPQEESTASAPSPQPANPTAPPSRAVVPPAQQSPAEQRQQMEQLKEEMGRVVQGVHQQLASGRPTSEVLADLRRVRTEYRQRLGTKSEVASITMEELDELEQQLLLRAHAQGQRQGQR